MHYYFIKFLAGFFKIKYVWFNSKFMIVYETNRKYNMIKIILNII